MSQNDNGLVPAKDLFFKLLQNAGAHNIFGNPGTTEFPFMDALADHPGINYRLAIHDAVAVGMAVGFSQTTGAPSVVNLHATPGMTNALGNIYNAHKSKVPVIVTAGQVDTHIHLTEPPLWGPMVDIVKPITKWAYEVKHAEELVSATRRALHIALTPPYGPVFLSLPADVLDGLVPDEDVSFTPLEINDSPNDDSVANILSLLENSQAPMLVVGDGLAQSKEHAAAVAFAELFGARVVTERIAPTVAFPTGHPQYFGSIGFDGRAIAETFNKHDLVIIAGASRLIPIVPDPELKIRADLKVIQIDQDSWEVAKVLQPSVGLIADPGRVLKRVVELAKSTEPSAAAQERILNLAIEHAAIVEKRAERREREQDAKPIAVSNVVTQLAAHIRPQDIVFDESLTSTPVLTQFADWNSGQYYGIKGTCLGWGLPAALGAQMAAGDSARMVSFIGDGAMMYAPQTLWSAAHYNMPLVVIVVNNRSYKILKEGMKYYREGQEKPYFAMDLENPAIDYVKLAESMGVTAERIENPEDVSAALQRAFASTGKPYLLEILVDRTVN
ncbi:MAG: thiamine pyrophosphate-binding protein [Microbacteriaceae bacterium]